MERAPTRFLLPLLAVTAIAMSAFALTLPTPPAAEVEPTAAPRPTPEGGAVEAHSTPRAAPTLSLESDDLRATVSSMGGALAHVHLKHPRYQRAVGDEAEGPIDIVTTDRAELLPLRLQISGASLPEDQPWRGEQLSAGAVRFTTQAGDVAIARKLEVGSGPYQIWSTTRVKNTGSKPVQLQVAIQGHHYVEAKDEEGGMFAGRSPWMAGAICLADGSPNRFDSSDVIEDKPSFDGPIGFGSVDNVYFTQAIAADGEPYAKCELTGSPRGGTIDDPVGRLLTVTLSRAPITLAPGEETLLRDLAYLGPKSPHILDAAGHGLSRASYVGGVWGIDRIAHGLVALLAAIQSVVPNWGVAIILLTLVVKLALYPLTAKSFESMAAMRKFKPEIDALNEKYAHDREKKGAAMMALYKEHKINPFGGCLPQLLQLPIWWALYTSLSTNVELYHRPFMLWWQDLAAPDPFYVLPIALGLLMFVQQKITPSTMDPQQAKMMLYMMPTMITAFMLFLPAGLCLYMFTNSLLSIAQQRFIEHRLGQRNGTGSPPTPAGSPSGTKPA